MTAFPISERRPLQSVAAIAEQLDTTTQFIYKKIESGELRAYRVGRLIKVDPDDVDDFVRPVIPSKARERA